MAQCVGVVLAGGAGRRLGGVDKGALGLGGVSLAERAASVLWSFCGSVLISVAPGAPNPAPVHRAIEDPPPAGRGPLAGIVTAFEQTGRADLFVLACDYPYVGPELVQCLLAWSGDAYDLVLPTDNAGRDHPLVGWWSRRVEPDVRDALDAGRFKVRALLGSWRVKRLAPADLPTGDPDRLLRNVNLPADLEA